MNITLLLTTLAPFAVTDTWGFLNAQAMHWPIPVLLAQINATPIDARVVDFLNFAQRLLVLPALSLAVFSAWCIHENKIRDAILSLVGAFLCATAVMIVKAIFGL